MDETGFGATGVEEGANQRKGYVDKYMEESGKECTGYLEMAKVLGTSITPRPLQPSTTKHNPAQQHHYLSPSTGMMKQGRQVSHSEV